LHFLPYRGVAFRTTLGEMRLLLKLQPSITKTHPKHSVIIYCKLQWLWNSYWYHHEHHRHHQTIDFQFHLMSQMNEHHDNGLNMCSIKSPNASPFADSINNLSSCSQDIINLIFSNQYYILFPSFRMRLAIHCVHMLNLGSTSGVTLRIVDGCCWIGTRLVFNCVCLW
jgi:hypothetical protein